MNKSFSAPVTANVTIYSGQVISLSSGSWILGCAAGLTPYIAFHDSTDPDVLSAGGLLGFSCSGNYTFETGWFTIATGAYNANDLPLVADTGTTVTPLGATTASGAGCVKLATGWNSTADIIGVTSNGGSQNVTGTNSEATPSGSPLTVQTLVFDTA